MIEVLIFSFFAGAMIPLGGWIADHENISADWLEREFRHSVIAFAAGALLSAVALVLVPEGLESLPGALPIVLFSLGAVAIALFHDWLEKRNMKRGQMIAMLTDFVPEALAMGALFAAKPAMAPLLAVLIGVQNLPEGFNAFREVGPPEHGRDTRLRQFALLALLGPVAALFGYFVLADYPAITGGIMCAAAGGILFLVFQDMAPQAKLDNRVAPPLSAVVGFMSGILGHMLMGVH